VAERRRQRQAQSAPRGPCAGSNSARRKLHGSAAIGNQIYLIGGDTSSTGSPFAGSTDISTSKISAGPPSAASNATGGVSLQTSRVFHDAVTVGGKSYVIGGLGSGGVLRSVEVVVAVEVCM